MSFDVASLDTIVDVLVYERSIQYDYDFQKLDIHVTLEDMAILLRDPHGPESPLLYHLSWFGFNFNNYDTFFFIYCPFCFKQ